MNRHLLRAVIRIGEHTRKQKQCDICDSTENLQEHPLGFLYCESCGRQGE